MTFEARGKLNNESRLSEEDRRILERQREKTPVSRPQEEIIERREKTSSQNLGGGANEVRFVNLKDDGSIVFKPKNGEAEIFDSYTGVQFKHERAAYLVSQFLGLDLVPPTVIRELDGDIGSAQEFISDAKEGRELSQEEYSELGSRGSKELVRLEIFDYLIWNPDRHGGNYLVKDKKIYAIDHGLAFREEGSCDSLGDHWVGAVLPEGLTEKLQKFLSWEDGKKILRSLLLELLDEYEADACLNRIAFVGQTISEGKISEELVAGTRFSPTI